MSKQELMIEELRSEVNEQKPKQIGPMQKISREDALREGEYMLRKGLEEEPKTENFAENFSELIEEVFRYFAKAGYPDISKDEFKEVILKDMR